MGGRGEEESRRGRGEGRMMGRGEERHRGIIGRYSCVELVKKRCCLNFV